MVLCEHAFKSSKSGGVVRLLARIEIVLTAQAALEKGA